MIKEHELSFPINLLPQEELELFLKHVQFSLEERKSFMVKLPKRSNQKIESFKKVLRDLDLKEKS